MMPTTRHTRVAIIDDDTLIREGLGARMPHIRVVFAAADIAGLRQRGPTPDQVEVVILDLRLNGLAGTGLQGRAAVLYLTSAGYRVLIYTNEQRPLVLVACLAAGARGLVHKTEPLSHLAEALGVISGGRRHVSPAVVGLAEVVGLGGQLDPLSPRQQEVLRARARGETFAAIGRRLYLSPRTVEDHMAQVVHKFADYLATHSAADLERELGLGHGDLLQ